MRILPFIFSLTLFPILMQARELVIPTPPDSLRVPQQRASFLARHYWDNMDWQDSATLSDTPFMEQNLSNFFAISGLASAEARREGIDVLTKAASASAEGTRQVASLAYTYLYSILSPFFDEESYLLFADALSTPEGGSDNLDEAELSRIASRRAEIMKNRVGEEATDFSFIDRDGTQRSLSSTPGRRLLIFYDNDCEQCDRLKEALANSGRLQSEIDGGALSVVAVESYGAGPEEWESKASMMPESWIVGRSVGGEIDNEEIYVLLTAPTIYLLDAQGRVEAKNLSPEKLEEALGFRL